MRHLLTICAESVVTDVPTNRVSIFNIVDELGIARFPAVIAKLSILFLVERSEGEPQDQNATMLIVQGGNEILRNPLNASFADKPRLRLTMVIQGLVIPNPGNVRVSLLENDREIGYWEFPTFQTEGPLIERQPQAQPAQPPAQQ